MTHRIARATVGVLSHTVGANSASLTIASRNPCTSRNSLRWRPCGRGQKSSENFRSPAHCLVMKPLIASLALFAFSASAQTPKFSYSTTVSLQVTADGFEDELRSELAREFQSIDGVQILTQSAALKVHVVAVKTRGPGAVVAAAVAVTSPLQGWLDAKVLRQSEEPSARDWKLGEAGLVDDLFVITCAASEVRDLARRIVAHVNSEILISNRDIQYRIFRAQHPDPH